jgi:hypothetical protein
LKAPPGTAGAEILPAQLLQQFLVPMHNAHSAPYLGLRGVSPSSAYWTFRKEGRLSKSSWGCMTNLLFLGSLAALPGQGQCGRTGVARPGAGDVAEQRDAADEGRLEPSGSIIIGNKVIVDQGEVVRPSQLIASVRPT